MISSVKNVTRSLEYLLDGDVFIDIDWMLQARSRRETDSSADVDNIIKPLLDALSGPDGVLIDDSQVKRFSSAWMDWGREDEQVIVRIEFIDVDYLQKEGLVFVQLERAMCYPIPSEIRQKGQLRNWIRWLKFSLKTKEKLTSITSDWHVGNSILPHGFFHRTRLKDFSVYSVDELLAMG